MRLSIIIPRYKEDEVKIFPLLSSINNQLGIDFNNVEVIISNDNPENTLDIKKFKILTNIKPFILNAEENMGPGVARQRGIDIAKGDYVMFCDADDILNDNLVLAHILGELNNNQAIDYLKLKWQEEIYDKRGGFGYAVHNFDNTWMHGKVINRQFLLDFDIRFDDNLRVHEDSYFLSLVNIYSRKTVELDYFAYIWRWGSNTITRNNNCIYSFDSFPVFIHAIISSLKVVMERRMDNFSVVTPGLLQLIFYVYFNITREDWQKDENIQYRDLTYSTLKIELRPFWYLIDNVNKDLFKDLYLKERARTGFDSIETTNIYEFINSLRPKYEDFVSTDTEYEKLNEEKEDIKEEE